MGLKTGHDMRNSDHLLTYSIAKERKRIGKFTMILILLAGASGLISCYKDNSTVSIPNAPTTVPASTSNSIEVELSLPYAPALNQTVDMTCTISSIYDITGLEVTIKSSRRLSPQNDTYIGTDWPPYATGNTITRTFNIKANQPVSFPSEIAFNETGFWRINVSAAGYAAAIDKYRSGENDLYLTVNADDGSIGWPLPGPAIYQQEENGDWVPITSENTSEQIFVQQSGENLPSTPALLPDGTWIPVEYPTSNDDQSQNR